MPAIMLPHGCEGLRVRRTTVLCTFRRPFMGRPVPRQLTRNELLDLTTIVPATAYHRRSYAERYSRFRCTASSLRCQPDVLQVGEVARDHPRERILRNILGVHDRFRVEPAHRDLGKLFDLMVANLA